MLLMRWPSVYFENLTEHTDTRFECSRRLLKIALFMNFDESKCKYVEIFTHRYVDSTGARSRRAVFVRGTGTKQWEEDEF
jgi:hypothetical protein